MLRLLAPLAVVLPLLLSVPAHAATTTTFVGYVTAGDRVSGATVTALGVHARTDANGYFVLRVPGKPALVRVTAAGGTVDGSALEGSLAAVVSQPGPARNAYLNPLTTIVAAYRDRHPQTSLTTATAKVRGMFTIPSAVDLGHDLMHSRAHLDGSLFLRVASHHGGLDRYVGTVVRRIESGGVPMRFGSTMPGVDWVKVLSVSASLVSIAAGTNDLLGWATKPQPSNGQIYDAVQSLKTELDGIQAEIAQLAGELQRDIEQLKKQIDQVALTQVLQPLKDLEGTIVAVEGYYEDLVANATSPDYSADIATTKLGLIAQNISTIEKQTNAANQVFRDAIVDGTTTSAYHRLGDVVRDDNGGFMTPRGSEMLDDFAQTTLRYQALAFQLVVTWEKHLNSVALQDTYVAPYLGTKASSWSGDFTAGSTLDPPPDGALHDESTRIAAISDVPAHLMVDENGKMWPDKTTPWKWSPFPTVDVSTSCDGANKVSLASYGSTWPFPPSAPHGYPFGTGPWYMCWNFEILLDPYSWTDTWTSWAAPMKEQTGLDGWRVASSADVQEFLQRPATSSLFAVEDAPFWVPDWLSYTVAAMPNTSNVVIGADFRLVDAKGSFSTCTWQQTTPAMGDLDGWIRVGDGQPTGPGVNTCGNPPFVVVRQTATNEKYWP